MHDDAGRVVELVTTREPEFDEADRALIDAYLNWKANIHSCGRPLSESLKDDSPDWVDPDYQVAVETCMACMAADAAAVKRAEQDKTLIEHGRHPESWREVTVLPLSDLPPEAQAAILADRKQRSRGISPTN